MYPVSSVVTPQNIVFTPYFTPDGFGGAGSAARIKSRNAVGWWVWGVDTGHMGSVGLGFEFEVRW